MNPNNLYAITKIRDVDSIFMSNNKEIQYQKILKIADSYFNIGEYKKASKTYKDAISIKKSEPYPIARIEEINSILLELESELSYPYHIIVGSFSIKSNALRLQKKLQSQGFNSRIILRHNGTFNAVTYTSHRDIHDAYNNLKKAKNLIHKDSWVLKYSFTGN